MVFKLFKFDLVVFNKTKALAVSTMISTASWVLFFQIDSFIVSKQFGINSVAIYAIPFLLLTFISNLYNTIYYPFLFRFTFFIASKNYEKLYGFLKKIFEFSFPIIILPTIILIFLMRPLIIGWVGLHYNDSILIGQVLIASLFFYFITMPYSYLLIALEKTKIINYNALILPLVFFTLIFFLKNEYSLLGLAIAKTVAFLTSAMYLYFNLKLTNFNFFTFLSKRTLSISLSLSSLFVIYYFSYPILEGIEPKNALSMVKTISFGLIMFFVSFLVYLAFDKKLIILVKNVLSDISNK